MPNLGPNPLRMSRILHNMRNLWTGWNLRIFNWMNFLSPCCCDMYDVNQEISNIPKKWKFIQKVVFRWMSNELNPPPLIINEFVLFVLKWPNIKNVSKYQKNLARDLLWWSLIYSSLQNVIGKTPVLGKSNGYVVKLLLKVLHHSNLEFLDLLNLMILPLIKGIPCLSSSELNRSCPDDCTDRINPSEKSLWTGPQKVHET